MDPYACAPMSELRRTGDPADRSEKADRPVERPDVRPQPADLPEFQSIDRRKTTAAQKDFVRETRDRLPESRKSPSSMDWTTGQPPDQPDARTLERTESSPGQGFSEVDIRDRGDRGIRRELGKRAEDITSGVHNGVKTVADILNQRPPTGHAVAQCPDVPSHVTPQYATNTAGDFASAVAAGSLVLAELGRRTHRTVSEWRERHADNG